MCDATNMEKRFRLRSHGEVLEAVGRWIGAMAPCFDEEFGLCLIDPASEERWRARLEAPASSRGHHGISQDSTYYAVALLYQGQEVQAARKILSRILEAQVVDKDAPYAYGQFKTFYEARRADILDTNSTFFVCLGLIPAVMDYPHLLGEELTQRIRLALARIPPEQYEMHLGIGYTNAAAANIAVWVTIADMLGDKRRLEIARRHFDHFYRVNMERGIAERLSMTYYQVDIAALGMLCRYVQDETIRARARELLMVFLQELLFFEDRQPLPARRTYNEHTGTALKWSPLDWLLGAIRGTAQDFEELCNAIGHGGFRYYSGGWIVIHDLLLRRVIDPGGFALPAPRAMRGRFVDDIGYTSYFHRDFTLGSFDRWPSLATSDQHPSDIPIAFAGAGGDLVYFGAYSIGADGEVQTHPGGRKVGMPSATGLPRLTYVAAQRANACCVLTNLRECAATLCEYGWMLRAPRFSGRLFDGRGRELKGSGSVESGWVFLAAADYVAGVYPLSHFDHTQKNLLEATATGLRFDLGASRLMLFAPCFSSGTPVELRGNNLPAGAILVLGSARENSLEAFQNACRQAVIEDEWYVDGFIIRNGYRDCERRVGLKMPGGELRLAFDYQRDEVVHRFFNERPIETPGELSVVQTGVLPWAGL